MGHAFEFASEMARKGNGSFVPNPQGEAYRQYRMRIYAGLLKEAAKTAAKFAIAPSRRRAIKLRSLKCTQIPYLMFDGDAEVPEEIFTAQRAEPLRTGDPQAHGGAITSGTDTPG